MSLNVAISGLKAAQQQMEMTAGNISNEGVVGFKRRIEELSTVTTNGGSVTSPLAGGVNFQARQTVSVQGEIQSTGNTLDIAIDGNGLFVTNDKIDGTGNVYYTRAGSLRRDSANNLVTARGDVIMGWQVDSEGRIPGEVGNIDKTSSSLLSSLKPININSASGFASATTKVDLGINLNAKQSVLKGSGQTLGFSRSSNTLNSSVQNDVVIVPSNTSDGIIKFGDAITIQASPPNKEYTYTYGGIAVSNIIDVNNQVLGATTINDRFPGAGEGDTIRLQTKNSIIDFRYKSTGSPNPAKGEFNSLVTLATAIDLTSDFTARIVDNRLYVSTKHGDGDIKFSNIQGNFKASLGLEDIEADMYRFSTLAGLNKLIANSDGMASLQDARGLDFYAKNPLGEFKIKGSSMGNLNTSATVAAIGSNLVEITANNHGLAVGSHIMVRDFETSNGVSMPDGIYMVETTPTANSFTLRAATAATAAGALNNSFEWKANAMAIQDVPVVVNTLANPNITTNVGSNLMQINSAAHGLANDEVIYLSGFNSGPGGENVKNGYYRIQVVDANNFTLEMESNANVASAAAPLGHGISWKKVKNADATFPANNAAPISTTNNSNLVRVDIPGHNYAVGDIFSFNNITDPGVYNNLYFDPNETYIITNTGANYIEFQAISSANSTGYIAGSDLNASYIDEFSRLFDELNLSKTDFKYGPAYHPEGGINGGNFSEGKVLSNVYSQPFTVFDSLGVEHNFNISFGKLDNNEWAVEIFAANKTDILTARNDSQVAAGTIRFNGDGSLLSLTPKLLSPIEIHWQNGAEPSYVSFNWGDAGAVRGTEGAEAIGGINGLKQVAASNEKLFITPNGSQPGLLQSVNIDSYGFVNATYSNGMNQRIFQIPLAQFVNYDGLIEISGNSYQASYLSGSPNLKKAGIDSYVGKIVPEALEGSNGELTEDLVKTIVIQRAYNANAKVVKVIDEMSKELQRTIS